MKIIVYCDDCMHKLKSQSVLFYTLYETIVENHIMHGKVTTFDLSIENDFVKEILRYLDQMGYINTLNIDENHIDVTPIQYNLRLHDYDLEDYICEIYDICFESQNHISYQIG